MTNQDMLVARDLALFRSATSPKIHSSDPKTSPSLDLAKTDAKLSQSDWVFFLDVAVLEFIHILACLVALSLQVG